MAEGGERGEQAALQVIVLGAGGGPSEDNITAFLVRSISTGWQKRSLLAVDAGVHLAAIKRLLKRHKSIRKDDGSSEKPILTLVDGPFEGLEIAEGSSPRANAAYITRELVDSFLITHPHLDHMSGFVINTAGMPSARPKRLAGLPSTIDAFKNHIFNNVIWPNLTDENNGTGLVTYLRLVEGGSPAIDDGYVEIVSGLSVKTLGVSHGHCTERHSHRGSNGGSTPLFNPSPAHGTPPRFNVIPQPLVRRNSQSSHHSHSGDDPRYIQSGNQQYCIYDSSVYFIRDVPTGKEVLIWGDTEPDTISLAPRNRAVWNEAAPKVASGMLGAIFIECSYEDSRKEELLFGHLTPKYLIEELNVLASAVRTVNTGQSGSSKKRKLDSEQYLLPYSRQRTRHESPVRPGSRHGNSDPNLPMVEEETSEEIEARTNAMSADSNVSTPFSPPPPCASPDLPLRGLKVVVIHVKEQLDDGPNLNDIILAQLKAHEKGQLGCEVVISHSGQSLYI